MPGIFISYRQTDTIAWAGRLFDHLSKSFGKSQVFMDIEGSIPRGADLDRVLTNALESCDVLLVLVGREWISCTCTDGRRRLDVPEDWVRNEIATALRRNIYIMPVLFGGASRPEKTQLPEDLRPLCGHRLWAEVTDTRWEYDVGEIIKDLIKTTLLQPLDDVASANTGIRLLKELLVKVPAVADAVSRSKEVIENTYRQVGKLELFKMIHDALHTIEFECLRPMQAGGVASRLRPFKMTFAGQARRIHEAIQRRELNAMMRDDLIDRLDLDRLEPVAEAFQAAVDVLSEAAYGQVVSALNGLLSGAPPKLDDGIADAARELNLDRLVELMTTVRNTLSAVAAGHDAELEPFLQSIDALNRLRDELTRRVSEHTQLQCLDSKLRTVCIGGIAPGAVASEWGRIKRVRARLVPPFSEELEAVNDDLVTIESDIEVAVKGGEEQEALDLLREYFRSASSVFRSVDGNLKEFCLRLSTVGQPLKTVLSML
jgi:TIR domain